eukprot:scaffold26870_cov176-Cylindrotheca_fusiformis.AAC.3
MGGRFHFRPGRREGPRPVRLAGYRKRRPHDCARFPQESKGLETCAAAISPLSIVVVATNVRYPRNSIFFPKPRGDIIYFAVWNAKMRGIHGLGESQKLLLTSPKRLYHPGIS